MAIIICFISLILFCFCRCSSNREQTNLYWGINLQFCKRRTSSGRRDGRVGPGSRQHITIKDFTLTECEFVISAAVKK